MHALRELGGAGTIVQVSEIVWRDHQHELEGSGDLFYTWQYDIRWAAQYLRDNGFLVPALRRRNAPWVLSDLGRVTDPGQAAVASTRV